MALSTPFVGSGEFVNVTVWSCPVHDNDVTEYDEGDPWEHEGEICLDCETGRWVAKRDAAGNVVTRELSQMEVWCRQLMVDEFNRQTEATKRFLDILGDEKSTIRFGWNEDETMPRIVQ